MIKTNAFGTWATGTCALVLSALICVGALAEDWPRFRGPQGDGHSTDKNLPVKWSAGDVIYRVALPGTGQSSPIIHGEKIFLTTSLNKGMQRQILCLNRNDGKVIWKASIGGPKGESLHKMNTWATASCVTDGKRVVAFFGPAGIHCYTVDGKKMWSMKLGEFPGAWGNAASPVIIKDTVIQNCDSEGNGDYLIALNKNSGEEVWRTKRKGLPRGGWSTPIIIKTDTREELVLNGEHGVQGYDPATGKDFWFCKSFNGRGTPMPAFAHGLLFVVNGKPGDVYAVRPGGSGDVTGTHMAWHTRRSGARDLPSPIVVGNYLLAVSMNGRGTCYDAPSGKELWVERMGGSYSASPIAANGLIYQQNEQGQVIVIKPGPSLEIVARNALPVKGSEMFRASLAASDGQIFARSQTALYCIGKRKPAE